MYIASAGTVCFNCNRPQRPQSANSSGALRPSLCSGRRKSDRYCSPKEKTGLSAPSQTLHVILVITYSSCGPQMKAALHTTFCPGDYAATLSHVQNKRDYRQDPRGTGPPRGRIQDDALY